MIATAIPAVAQSSAAHFETASIKPSNPGAVVQDMRLSFENNRLEAVNITLKELLSATSGFSASTKVQGGPSWTETERYNIVAKAEGEVPANDRNGAVMALLEERFKLVAHREKKEASGMALTVGKKPPAMQRSEQGTSSQITGDRHQLVFRNTSMGELAHYLSMIWRTTVEDHTGMPGVFDFSVRPEGFASSTTDKFADLLRTAMEDLGFVLQARKVMLDVTVIDRAERPTEN